MAWGIWDFTHRADAFRVVDVRMPSEPVFKLKEPLLGRNIWALHLPDIAHELRAQQPWLKDVRVVRKLPNIIEIQVIPRRAVAQIKLDRWYRIDGEGVLLPELVSPDTPGLVRVLGVRVGRASLKVGAASPDEGLQLALRVMKRVQSSPVLTARKLEAVDVSDPAGIRLMLDGETEVRCGAEDELSSHLERLRTALRAVQEERLTVKYIDVRFQDPVVAPRT